MDGVGARLRDARLQRGLDLAEVEAATKIQARFLAAIEREEWDALPGEFYARSFVRAYAGHLGLADAGMAAGPRLGGADAAADRTPRIDPAPPQRARPAHRGRRRRILVALATLALGAILVAAGLSSLNSGSSGPSPAKKQPPGTGGGAAADASEQPPPARGASLSLTATAEVWVCLLDKRGQALIDGQILGPGSEAGPYRSGGFTVALGNGAVTMSVEGREAPIPPTPNPIGFAIDRDGSLRQLTEAERPDCA